MKPRHLFLLIAAQILWGANFAVIKLGLADWPPLFFIALRLFAVALILLPIAGLPRAKEWPGLIAIGLILGLFHFCALFIGLTLADAATTALLVQIQVPLSLLLGLALGETRFQFKHWLGIALAFLGLIALVGRPEFKGGLVAAGLILSSACSWVIVNHGIKRLTLAFPGRMNGWRLNAWTALIAGPVILALSLATESGQGAALAGAGRAGWISLLYQILIVTALCYGIWYAMIDLYPVAKIMPFTLLEPLFGTIVAILLLGEGWDLRFLLGGLAILAGLALLVFERAGARAPELSSESARS